MPLGTPKHLWGFPKQPRTFPDASGQPLGHVHTAHASHKTHTPPHPPAPRDPLTLRHTSLQQTGEGNQAVLRSNQEGRPHLSIKKKDLNNKQRKRQCFEKEKKG